MKRLKILLICLLCLLMTACSNGFAKSEYDAADKIAQQEDHYAKEGSVFNPIDRGYSLTVSKFDGRQTLWTETAAEDQAIDMDFSLSLQKGRAKIVHIDKDGNVTTVIECTAGTPVDGVVTKTVALGEGQNRLKLVGYGCEDLELEMLSAFF